MVATTPSDLLSRARRASDTELGSLSVELAVAVLRSAELLRTKDEGKQRARLSLLLASKAAQQLGLLLTDRVYRSVDPGRTVKAVQEAIRLLHKAPDLALWDRVQLLALQVFGAALAPLATLSLKARLQAEASAFVLNAELVAPDLARLRALSRRINLNQLGEEVLGERDSARYVENTISLIQRRESDAVSVKLSSLYSQARVLAFDAGVGAAGTKLGPILEAARRAGTLIYFDMEAFKDLDMTVEIFLKMALSENYRDVRMGIALQAYLPDSLAMLERVIDCARSRVQAGGRKLRVRIVKGANLAAEAVFASTHGLALPIFESKHEVDAHIKRLLRVAVQQEHAEWIEVGLGSHNVFDQAYAVVIAERQGAARMLELEMLFGMAESVGTAWTRLGRSVLVYAPLVAPDAFPAAIAYLVRRLDENTSPQNFLAASLGVDAGAVAGADEAERFRAALEHSFVPTRPSRRIQDRRIRIESTESLKPSSPFENAADTDWTRPWNREALRGALEAARSTEFLVSPRIGGANRFESETTGFDPSLPGQAAYRLGLGGSVDVARALFVGHAAEPSWSRTRPLERAELLERAALELENDRLRLIALMVKDAGKRAEEADIEVSEAVDFARYYARDLLRLDERYRVRGRGLTVVTPPWNFPLAIPLGGCLAALAAGNPVILKPSPETPLVAQAGAEALWRAGIPENVFQFVPCDEDVAGPLICDERVSQVVLTGATSTAKLFLRMRPRLRLLAETGGKNGAFVSALADRDAAIHAIVTSAFGHAGQKCSALSLLVLEQEVFEDEHFRAALVDASESLPVGSAWQPESFVTPLIRPPGGPLCTVLRRGDGRARWALEPRTFGDNPGLVSPGILWGVPENGFAHRTEFFGPILSVLAACDLEHGLQIMNATPYGLTAGIFSLSEGEQCRFIEGMDAGNLYLNRGLTGAVVGRQPFGGRKASSFGPGAKAGGPGYLSQFAHLERRVEEAVPVTLARVHGTSVIGEANWLDYGPATVLLYIGQGADEADVAATLDAARSVGARVYRYLSEPSLGGTPVSLPDSEGFLAPWISGDPRTVLRELKTTRVRLVGAERQDLRALVPELGLTILDDPVSADPELEARHYVLEQSVSIAYHRYGNVSLKELHPLLGSE